MLYLSANLSPLPIISLRTGARIGTTIKPVINPHNLHIDAFLCDSVQAKDERILLDMHIREWSSKGIAINDQNDLSEPDELIRLQPILELEFQLIGKTVVANNKKIGKVSDYAVDQASLFIQKLYVHPPVWKGITATQLVFDRKSILEVTDTKIVVSGPEEKAFDSKKAATGAQLSSYSASTSLISEKE